MSGALCLSVVASATAPIGEASGQLSSWLGAFSGSPKTDLPTAVSECPLLPIALPASALNGVAPGAPLPRLTRGTASNHFSWLSWTGSEDLELFGYSLKPPGDSHTYLNPDDASDLAVDAGDWVWTQSAAMNTSLVQTKLDALRYVDVIVPVWAQARDASSRRQLQVQRFVWVRLNNFRLSATPWIELTYLRDASCDNRPPRFITEPPRFARVGRPYRYDSAARDPDQDPVTLIQTLGPVGTAFDPVTGRLTWTPNAAQLGLHAMGLRAADPKGASSDQNFDVRVVQDFCAIYPITLPSAVLDGLSVGATINQLPRGTGPGNFSWLSWSGATDAPTLANSLQPPGDSYTYRNPDNSADQVLNIADFAQGATGSMNAAAVREALDRLKQQDILLPAWSERRGQGSRFDYRVHRFIRVRLLDYQLTDQGWLSFEYKGEGQCYNTPPVAQPQRLTTPENVPLPLQLQGSDVDGQALSFSVPSAPAHGRLEGAAPNLIYVPDADFNGEDAFEFTVFDGIDESVPARIEILVTPINDAPIAQAQHLETAEDTPLALTLEGSDPEGAVLSFRVLRGPLHGSLQGSPPALVYQPAPDFHGIDSLEFVVNDGEIDSAPATVRITVTPRNDAPIAQPQQLSTPTGVALPITLAGDDPDNDPLEFRVVQAPANGSLSGSGATLVYTPQAGFRGEDSFDFVANDGELDSAPAIVRIEVVGSNNEPPRIVSEPVTAVDEGASYSYDVDAIDPDGDALRYVLEHAPADMQIDPNTGLIGWAPTQDLVGPNLQPNLLCLRPGVSVNSAPPAADVVFVVDESGSMSGEHAWLADVGLPLEAHLATNGVGVGAAINRYGVLGYDPVPRPLPVEGANLGSIRGFEAAAALLRIAGSGTEDGWRAVRYVLQQYALRPEVARNIILVTDEDRDNTDATITYDSLLAELLAERATLNAVVDVQLRCGDNSVAVGLAAAGVGFKADGRGGYTVCSGARAQGGYGTTIADYVNLALATGGAAWDLNALRQGGLQAQSFTNALISVKVREILEQVPPTPQADLFVADLVAQQAGQVQVLVGNRGRAGTALGSELVLLADGQELARQPVPALAVDTTHALSFAVDLIALQPERLQARIEFPTPVEECKTDNNSVDARWVRASATDPAGLSDQQSFSIQLRDSNAAPSIVSQPLLAASVGGRYQYQIEVQDPDRGDAHEHRLLQGPIGFSVDRLSGRASFVPLISQAGTHPVDIEVRDLAGATVRQQFQLEVGSTYIAPRFVSEPPLRAIQGTQYDYLAQVQSDPSATLQYDVFLGPQGMSIDANGAVAWAIPGDFYGKVHRVLLRVRDQYGNYDLQMFVLQGDRPNVAPTITGTAAVTAPLGVSYSFDANVSDPNVLEAHVWRGLALPAGATINAGTGVVQWPAAAVAASSPGAEIGAYNAQCLAIDPQAASLSLVPLQTAAFATRVAQPLVGPLVDRNRDGRLDHRDGVAVVAISQRDTEVTTARIHAFDYETLTRRWSYNGRVPDWYVAPAMGDLKGDDQVSILFVDTQARLVALDGEGSLRWVSEVPVGAGSLRHVSISLADLDGDREAEILVGPSVFDADGRLLWQFPTYSSSQSTPLAIDLDGDGRMEVLHRHQARSHSGQLLWTTPSGSTTNVMYSVFAPITLADGSLGIVASEQTSPGVRLSLLRADGTQVWRREGTEAGLVATPLVADFDGDGVQEIFLPSSGALYGSDGQIRWTAGGTAWPRTSFRAAVAGDFNGDGAIEILGFSSNGLTALSGASGALLARDAGWTDNASYHMVPGVLDVRGDGDARLLAAGAGGLRSYRPLSGRWRSQVRVFHQQAWAADRVTPQLLIPPAQAGRAHAPMQLLAVAEATGDAGLLSDLHLLAPSAVPQGTGLQLRSTITNRGTLASRGFAVEFRRGSPSAPGTLLGRVEQGPLAPGANVAVTLDDISLDVVGREEFYAELVTDATELECETRNNRASARVFEIAVVDYGGLEAQRAWAAGVLERRDTPRFTSIAPTVGVAGELYRYHAQAVTSHVGDSLSYTLSSAPAGARLDPVSGEIEWRPGWSQTGSFRFTITVSSLSGRAGAQSWNVVVGPATAPNTAPVITSTPVLQASIGEPWSYLIEAEDAEGHALSYAQVSGPVGLSIDAAAGYARWTPTTIGTASVEVRVTDERGASTTQSFQIQVTSTPNRAPAFDSVPQGIAYVGETWTYAVQVSDPDGDAVQLALNAAPSALLFDASQQVLSYTPTAQDIGAQFIELEANDGRGGSSQQRIQLPVVQVVPGNQPPGLSGSPVTSAMVGITYSYQPTASDPDGDSLLFSLSTSPAGAQIDPTSGALTWTPRVAQLGAQAFVVRVDDGRGGWATQSFSVDVQPNNNATPVITSLPGTQGKSGREYRYNVFASDADGDALIYSLMEAPAGMQIAADGRITWTPAAAGSVPVRVRVQDALAWVEQSWTIDVAAADVPLQAQVSVSPNPAQAGAPITISVSTSGAAAAITASATLNGQPVALDPDGSTTINAPSQPGNYALVVTVSDGYDTVQTTATVSVANAGGSVPPTVSILSPSESANADLLVVTQRLPVRASVNDDNLRSWALVVVERGARPGEFIPVASGSNTFSDVEIGTLDPTLLQNGQYALLLQAEDLSGNRATDLVALSVEGEMKIGHFSISFEDVSVPVAGIPVSVTRTYDTRVRHKRQDFGHGWSLDYQNVRVQESRTPGFGWSLNTYPSGPLGLIPNYCVESALGNVVSIVLGDGRVEKFKVKASPACNQAIPFLDVTFAFEPTDGARGRLETVTPVGGRLVNGSIADLADGGQIADPNNYRYIDPEGREYRIDQGFGLREIFEREGGNRVTFDRSGITHSNGFALQFTRDAQDRITRITGPGGIDLSYAYSTEGDLASVEDAEDNLTRFEYQSGHYLRDIIDPRGVRVSRNEYDADGRLVAVIDADGHRVEFSRDIDGRVEQRRDRNGRTTVYVYNTRGDIISETNGAGETITRTYDDIGNTLSETDALGRTRRWTYDSLGNVLTETDPLGGVTRSVFGQFNQLQTLTDPLGVVSLRQTYRNILVQGVPIYPGPLVSLTDATGGVTGMGYDPSSGELTSITDASGATTRYEYDANGFKTAEVDALGHRTTYVNDAQGRLLEERRSRTRADGSTETLVSRYTLDANGNVIATEHPDGSISTTVFDANGKPIESCDPLNRCTLTTYDNRGNVARVDYPDGTREASSFDPNGNLIAHTDRGGRTTRHVYDEANRLIEVIHPDATPADDSDNPRSRKAYDDAGQLIADTDENGHTTEYRYDAAGRMVRTLLPAVDGQVAEIVVEYDLAGRKIRETDPLGAVTRYTYDAAGRLLSTEAPAVSGEPNAIVRTEYDAVGRKTAEIDASGRSTRFGYDGLGRLILVVLPNPATGANPALVNGSSPDAGTLTTRYAYDEVGNKIRQTDAEGRETRWEFDEMGRETARILPGGEREEKRYNAAGELIEHTDFRGRVTRYTYDAAGRLQTIDYPSDADHSFVYNAAGERIEAVDERGTSRSEFDARGRLLRLQDADGGVIDYRHDAVGNLLERRSPSQTLLYRYDARNRLIEVERRVQGEAPALTRYSYDAAGRRSTMEGGDGTRTEYAFDSRHRLRGLVKRSALGALLMGMGYQVDADGLRTQISESDATGLVRTVQYDYDAVKRLVAERIDHRIDLQDRQASWSYDRVGNRLRQSVSEAGAAAEVIDYVYDSNDRLQSERGADIADYAYDPAGNLLSHGTPTGTTEYVYNDAGRMREARSAGEVNAYVYNADGLRVRSTRTQGADSETTWILQDPSFEYAQSLEHWRSQNAGPRHVSAVFSFGDELLSQTRFDASGAPSTVWLQTDGFGSTRAATDASGSVIDQIDYDAFGNEIGRSGSTAIEHLYRGEAFDPNVGFYYLRARWMDPRVGRFTQQDAFAGFGSDPMSLNKYLYAHSSAPNFSDPSGYVSLAEQSAVSNIQGILQVIGRVDSALRLYGRVNSAVDLVMGLRQLLLMFEGDLSASVPRTFPPRVNFADAAQTFVAGGARAFGIGSPNWLAGYVADYTKGRRMTAYVIYLPVLIPQLPSLVNAGGRKINGKPVRIGLGAPGGKTGSLGGVGVVMGNERMLFRMDIGTTPTGHITGRGNELTTFDDAPFSFHVYSWRGGPR
ncbi:Ig-like domain-containing protein [uncultured Aquimonas sp.]|uniref:Ig-like domain-containing protein n=1 Tax=uncultured Aquimonas sp. TaxID=385483 RepID=UPI002624C789|nr:Ig-like domain-containing protein [uncultured Aquimonas sp.]